MGRFLEGRRDERVWTVAREERGTYWTGEGQNALEVVYVESASEPSRSQVTKLWHERQGRRAAPVLLVAAWPTGDAARAWLCGPIGEDPPMAIRDLGQAERLAAQALAEPSRTFAIQYLNGALAEVDDPLPGVRNDGLLATHELREGVRLRRDWKAACERSRSLVNLRDRALVAGLGYRIDQRGDHAVLRAADGEEIRAVAVFLDRGERPDRPSARFDQRTPVTHALTLADREGLRWVVAVRGSTLRLYSTATSGAAGQRGRTETFVELDLPLLADEHAGYLSLLFAADALAAGGTFDEIATASRDFTTGLSERMRERIYERTVPNLALAIARSHDGPLDKAALDAIYHAALTVLFRLLFVAYAEDQRLLPYAASEDYRANSLKAIAQRFAGRINAGEPLGFADPFSTAAPATPGDRTDELWSRCRALFQAVDKGNTGWDIPPYNGGLFSETSPEGARIAGLSLTNAEFGPALAALLLDRTPDGGVGPIDFRSLSVREFGSIYEGLLESDLAVAEQDLALKTDAEEGLVYVPAGEDDEVVVPAGAAYLHNASGARKTTGSYFTPAFAVDHLLDTALRPALNEHLDRVEVLLDAGDEVGAAELLLDFRVADISMGSGHFLTAAIDAIEALVTDFLARRPIPRFSAELARLHRAATDALGGSADRYDIEGAQLLRRLIARRCIYGVDLNPISVELARVSVWIHTFVPGLPLSFLDRTLVVGDSLTGIGTIAEALEELLGTNPDAGSYQNFTFFDDPVRAGLRAAEEPLRRLGAISDATLDEVAEAKSIADTAREAIQPISDLFDLIVAQRLGEVHGAPVAHFGELPEETVAVGRRVAHELGVIHFPVAFPEVFLRERGGFDVIVGNPPWKEVTVERDRFWTAHAPGLQSLSAGDQAAQIARLAADRPDLDREYLRDVERAERYRRILLAGPFPGLGTGDPDLYKAFSWRFWHLTGAGGRTGVVLPRSALSAAGSAEWRRTILTDGALTDVVVLKNTAGWIFESVTPQYTVALVVFRRGRGVDETLTLWGPFSSRSQFDAGLSGKPAVVGIDEFSGWTSTAALPLLPTTTSASIFATMRRHTPFRDLPFRYVRELDASNDRKHMISDDLGRNDVWTVYGGKAFDLWTPETGRYYAWADPDYIMAHLQAKRLSQARRRSSVMSRMPREWVTDPTTLPVLHPRIAFRDIARATDKRTLIACLVPGQHPLTNKAPYLLRLSEATTIDEAYLLGVLSSIPMDWQMRRTVELTVNLNIIEPAGVPWPDHTHPGRVLVAEAAARLATPDERFAVWAEEAGVAVGSVGTDEERDDLVALIDAAVARLYGLDHSDVEHIFETFHAGWDPSDRDRRLGAVLTHLEGFAWDPAPTP